MSASFLAFTCADIAEPRPRAVFMALSMTLAPYTRIREGEGHELFRGVRNGSHRVRSRLVEASSESMERPCPATSAQGTARCASRGPIGPAGHPQAEKPPKGKRT